MKKNHVRLLAFSLVGAGLGFAYYFFIGCRTGTCPISSNPFISTAYGALMGGVLGWGGKEKKTSPEE